MCEEVSSLGVSPQIVNLAYFGYKIMLDICLLDNETKKHLPWQSDLTFSLGNSQLQMKMFGCWSFQA